MTKDQTKLNALLVQYQSLRDESLKSIEWRLTLFSGGFAAIVAVSAGAIALQESELNSAAPIFACSYVIPVTCLFVLINWVGEAARCQRVSYFLASNVEPQINEILGSDVMRWEMALNSGTLRRDEIFGPSMYALTIMGLIAGISPVIGVDYVLYEKPIETHQVIKWLVLPYSFMTLTGSFVAGLINRVRQLKYTGQTSLDDYYRATRYSWKFFLIALSGLGAGCATLTYLFLTVVR